MKKNILFPTDFSDNAWSAVVYALKLYAKEECTFYFLHSSKMTVSAMSSISNKLTRVMAENAMKDLVELKDMAKNTNVNANHNFDILLSSQDIQSAIESAISKYDIDLIVMGTKGSKGTKEFFFGSNTVRIIKNIKSCPVLIVPDEFDYVEPKKIAFPTDFSRIYDYKELDPIRDLAELYDAKIMPVCILSKDKLNDIQEYNMAMLESHLKNYKTSFHFMPNYDKKSTAINDFIELTDINILAMVNYKHSFIEDIVKEPIIKKIGFHPLVPFLVIPA